MKISRFLTRFLALSLGATTLLPLAAIAGPEGRRAALSKLNLTETQKTELRELRQSTRDRTQSVLTDEQQAELKAAHESGIRGRQAMRSLELSEQQRTEILQIRDDSRAQRNSILTDEQLQELKNMRQERRKQRQEQPVQ
ncbi:MAG: hypothetical protein AAGG02_20795 [Cyanobacteria bacterium P01_H01_bin.15]